MKQSIKAIRKFVQKEWFLLIAVSAITLIITLFEVFN